MSTMYKGVQNPTEKRFWRFETILTILIILSTIAVASFIIYEKNQPDGGKFKWDIVSQDAPENLKVEYHTDQPTGSYISFYTNKDADRTIDIFADPRCPVCQRFEESNKDILKDEVAQGETVVRFHMMTFLDDMMKSTYSGLTTSSLITLVKNNEADVAWNFYQTLWNNQPPENKMDTPSNEYIVDVLDKLNASNKSLDDIHANSDDFQMLAKTSDAENTKAMEQYFGKVSTPAMLLNDKPVKNPMKSIDWKA